MKVLWCLRCSKTSFAIAKVGNSAQRTVYATNKRCLARNFALVKQVETVETFAQWLSIFKRKMIHRMCNITEKYLLARIVQVNSLINLTPK